MEALAKGLESLHPKLRTVNVEAAGRRSSNIAESLGALWEEGPTEMPGHWQWPEKQAGPGKPEPLCPSQSTIGERQGGCLYATLVGLPVSIALASM